MTKTTSNQSVRKGGVIGLSTVQGRGISYSKGGKLKISRKKVKKIK